MKYSKDLLDSVIKTTQMGQVGIRSVLNNTNDDEMRSALKSQMKEYDTIEKEALSIASSRGWELKNLDPSIKMMTNMMTKMRLSYGNSTSKAAAMMVNGNTRGMIKGLKNLHNFEGSDNRITNLTQKLIECEEENIRQMQRFI